MANYQSLKTAINAVIKANGNKEITGTVLNEVLLAMVNSLGAGYQFAGVATPSTNPGTPDQKVFYIASQAGTYTNFNGAVVSNGIAIFEWNGTWTTETLDLPVLEQVQSDWTETDTAKKSYIKHKPNIPEEQVQSDWTETDTTKKSYIKHKPNIPPSANVDTVPTNGSPNAVASGGVYNALKAITDFLNNGYYFVGMAGTSTVPDSVTQYGIFYIASDGGTYTNFLNGDDEPLTLYQGLNILYKDVEDDGWNYFEVFKFSDFVDTTRQQSLSSQQKAQARTNIATVSYEQQPLNAGQQVQAQNNMMGKAYSSVAADHSGLGKVYLAKNNGVLTQSMMQATNTIFVIQYDYTMSGNITVPANCVLEFDGGSIGGDSYTLTGNNTELSGDIRLDVLFGGTFKNENLKATQLINKTAARLSNVIVSMFNIGLGLYVDENITLDGTQKTVSMVKFIGNNKTISQTNSFTVNGNVTLKDVRFNNFPNNEIFLNVNDFTARSYFIDIDNIGFDGSDHCHRFINHLGSNDLSSVSNITVTNSTFKNILECAIRICAEIKQGYIAQNTFSSIGCLTSQLYSSIAIFLGKTYLEKKIAENVIIENNVITDIKCYYTLTDDGKETHGILLYGNNCVIRNNVIENIYSNQEDGDPGAETEGIYVKGSYNTITGNHLTNTCGTGSDGSITLKGLEFTDLAVNRDSNTITGNVTHNRFGNGITSYGTNGVIKNNILYGEYKATGGIALYASAGNIVDGNTIVVNNIVNGSSDRKAYNGFMVISNSGHNILSNNVCTGKAGLYISSNTTIKDCKFTVEDTRFGIDTRYTSFIYNGAACDIVFENNTFNFGSCRATAMMEMPTDYAVNIMIRKCMFNFYVYSSASVVSSPFFQSLFRNGSVKIIDTVMDISSGVDVRKVFYEATDKYWANSIFTDASVDINTTKVIGDYQFPA